MLNGGGVQPVQLPWQQNPSSSVIYIEFPLLTTEAFDFLMGELISIWCLANLIKKLTPWEDGTQHASEKREGRLFESCQNWEINTDELYKIGAILSLPLLSSWYSHLYKYVVLYNLKYEMKESAYTIVQLTSFMYYRKECKEILIHQKIHHGYVCTVRLWIILLWHFCFSIIYRNFTISIIIAYYNLEYDH